MLVMRRYLCCLATLFLFTKTSQAKLPTFEYTTANSSVTILGRDPAQGGRTLIPIVVVPVALAFESRQSAGKPYRMDPAPDMPALLQSPIFQPTRYSDDGTPAQYLDGLLRSSFATASDWHTILASPRVQPGITVRVPLGSGYVLSSRRSGRSVGIADLQFVQREIFKQIAFQEDTLVLAVTHNVAFYAEGDATICCSFGTQGTDSATGNAFVLASYFRNAPSIVEESDVQPLTEHLAEFANDPLHDPLLPERGPATRPGNSFPPWMRPASMSAADQGRCTGSGVASPYFLLEPTDINPKNNFPLSRPFITKQKGVTYHLQNAALLRWYFGASANLGSTHSFPDPEALSEPAKACPAFTRGAAGQRTAPPRPAVAAVPHNDGDNSHKLIGYWSGYGAAGSIFPLSEISPQWDVIIVAFSTPDPNAAEGTMQFHTPSGLDTAEFKADIQDLKSKGKKILISLGGGGQHFTLADPRRIPTFVSSVTRIVTEYGFDGIDIDFESPSLSIQPGDSDFRHPTTPSIVNLIDALRQLRDHFGVAFAITLVPEGTQIPAGYPSYGGQFGSYLPIAYALKDVLTFMDVQDYNTPPLQGLDGEIYQAGTVDYHAAMTELVLRGFPVGGNPKQQFPALPANKVAVGYLIGETTPQIVRESMDYIITGKAPAGVSYRLQQPGGYPEMIGAMFWTIDADRRGSYNFSNFVGPQLHNYRSNTSGSR